jgi:hypothetical protein
VKLKDKALWLDPTNFQVYPEGVFEDIAERKALILDPKKITLEEIKFPALKENRAKYLFKISITKKKTFQYKVILDQAGMMAVGDTGALLRSSKEQFTESLISDLTNRAVPLSYKLESREEELRSHIVQPRRIVVSYEIPYDPIITSMGPAVNYYPPANILDLAYVDRNKRVSDLRLGVPKDVLITIDYSNMKMLGDKVKDCRATSSWLEYTFRLVKQPFQVKTGVAIKKFSISAAEMRTPEFEKFQKQLKACALPKNLIFSQ